MAVYNERGEACRNCNEPFYRTNPRQVHCGEACRKSWKNQRLTENHYLRNFGITLDEFREIADLQDNKCAICGRRSPSGRRLDVDHCHETGDIRGLLCSRCNIGIGYFDDDPELLELAVLYLTQAR